MTEYGDCPVCGGTVALMTPRGGDGSLVVLRVHGPRRARCLGSRQEPVPSEEQ